MAASGLAQLLFAVVLAVAARHTSPGELGSALVVMSIALGISGVLDFGLSGFCIRQLSAGKASTDEVSERLFTRLLGCLIAAAVVSVLGAIFSSSAAFAFGSAMAICALISQMQQTPLRAAGMAERCAVVVLVDRATLALTFFVLTNLDLGIRTELWTAYIVGSLTGAALALSFTPKESRLRFYVSRRNPWRGAQHWGIFAIGTASQTFDLPLLAATGGAYAAGLYGAVSKWTSVVGLISNTFASTAIPFFATSHGVRDAWAAVRRGAWMLYLTIGACLIVAIWSSQVTVFILGPQYAEAHVVLRLLAIAAAMATINQPMASYLMTIGKDRVVAQIMLLLTALQLGALALASPHMGAAAAGWAVLGMQVASLIAFSMLLLNVRPANHDEQDEKWLQDAEGS